MARARNIKPGFFSNELLAEIPPLGRLLFAGLWTIADREGRLEDRPAKIKATILPYDECSADDFLSALSDRNFIVRYEIGGRRFLQIVNWEKHQNPHVKEQPSAIPAPDIPGARTGLAPGECPTCTEVAQDIPVLIPGSLDSLIPRDVSPAGDEDDELPEPKAPRPRKAPASGAVGAYLRAWEARYGSTPLPEASECISVNRALSRFTEEERVQIVEAYVADDDPWICDKAHPLGLLPKRLGRLQAKLNGTLSPGRRPNQQRSLITPPGFRAEDEKPGTSKLDGLPVEEV